jgi:hypothetical protein
MLRGKSPSEAAGNGNEASLVRYRYYGEVESRYHFPFITMLTLSNQG